jgi:hypothetical protein
MKSIVYLALLGLVSFTNAETEAAAGGDHAAGGEHAEAAGIPWYWSADNAIASEKYDTDENPIVNKSDDGGAIMSACFGLQACAGFR